jgi:hypothetical protein
VLGPQKAKRNKIINEKIKQKNDMPPDEKKPFKMSPHSLSAPYNIFLNDVWLH